MKKIIATAAMIAMLTGCASTSHYGGSSRYHATQTYNVEVQKKRVHYAVPKSSNLEELLSSVNSVKGKAVRENKYKAHNNQMHQKYQSRLSRLDNMVKAKKFSEVRREVHNNVNYLKREKFKSKDDFIKAFKDYSYIRVDYVTPEYREKKSVGVEGLIGGTILLPFAAAFAITDTVLGGNKSDNYMRKLGKTYMNKKESKVLKDGHYKMYRVSPYVGREKLIKTYKK